MYKRQEQGGAADLGAEWTRHPWWPDALALRRFDDAAKIPGASALSIDEVVVVARRVLDVERGGH